MVSAGRLPLRRRYAALSLAALVLLLGIVALMLAEGQAPAAHADTPTLFLSTGMTNPGGEVDITGTGWAPATHYNLYVYGQVKCKPNPTCPPPDLTKPINASPQRINSKGNLSEFSFFFSDKASITTYVFTVVADYPTDTPYSASALVQVVPLGTPTATGTVSSAPSPSPTTAPPTQPAVSPTAQQQTPGTGTGTTTTPSNSSGSSSTTTVLIIVVSILLLLMLGVLGILLYTLPAKRREIRAQYYGEGAGSSRGYAPVGQAARKRPTGGYPPMRDQEMPWQGGVASWDDQPRQPRRTSNPYSPPPSRTTPRPPPPRRPSERDW